MSFTRRRFLKGLGGGALAALLPFKLSQPTSPETVEVPITEDGITLTWDTAEGVDHYTVMRSPSVVSLDSPLPAGRLVIYGHDLDTGEQMMAATDDWSAVEHVDYTWVSECWGAEPICVEGLHELEIEARFTPVIWSIYNYGTVDIEIVAEDEAHATLQGIVSNSYVVYMNKDKIHCTVTLRAWPHKESL